MPRLGLRLTPHGHLLLDAAEDAPILDNAVAERLAEAFGRSTGHGLVQLGAGEVGHALPPVFVWWRDFAARYVATVCLQPRAPPQGRPSPLLPRVPPPSRSGLRHPCLDGADDAGGGISDADVLLALWA